MKPPRRGQGADGERPIHRRPPAALRRLTRLHLGTSSGVMTLRRRGQGWGPLAYGLAGAPVTAIAVLPGQPDTIYAASGGALHVSPDSGSHWRPVSQAPGGAEITALLIDPRPQPRLVAGLRSAGVVISDNGGATWQPAAFPVGESEAVTRLLATAGEAGQFYALAGGRVLVSRDHGQRWEPLAELHAPVDSLSVHPEAPSTLYAGGPTGLFRTRNAGRNWQRLASQPISAVLVHPARPRTLLAALPTGLAVNAGGPGWQAVADWPDEGGQPCGGLYGHNPGEIILAVTASGRLLQIVDGRGTPLPIGPTPPVLTLVLTTTDLSRLNAAPKRSAARRRRPAQRDSAGRPEEAAPPEDRG